MIKLEAVVQVSVSSMNEVHKEEVEIINELLEQLESKVEFEKFSASFEKFITHMQEHFAGEEKLMKELQYPSLQMHKADHDKVLNQTRYVEMQWRNRRDEEAIREYLEDEIVVWLDQHIKAMDTLMADYISQTSNYSPFSSF